MDTTLDGLLNRCVQIEQPVDGYRVAMDTVLLAAAVPAKAGDKILDFGCGIGGAMLCLACRVPGVSVTGIDIQNDLVEFCRRNIARNKFQTELKVEQGDVTKFLESGFDHVMMNPPYHEEARHEVSAHTIKRTANTEKSGDLILWIESSARALRPDGMLTIIHRADRLNEILGIAQQHFGANDVLPLLPKVSAAPKRVIIRAVKNQNRRVSHSTPLVLHNADGSYTDEAESVLRDGKTLEFRVV